MIRTARRSIISLCIYDRYGIEAGVFIYVVFQKSSNTLGGQSFGVKKKKKFKKTRRGDFRHVEVKNVSSRYDRNEHRMSSRVQRVTAQLKNLLVRVRVALIVISSVLLRIISLI